MAETITVEMDQVVGGIGTEFYIGSNNPNPAAPGATLDKSMAVVRLFRGKSTDGVFKKTTEKQVRIPAARWNAILASITQEALTAAAVADPTVPPMVTALFAAIKADLVATGEWNAA